MRSRLATGWLSVAVAACAPPYEGPCQVQAHRSELATGFTPDLQPSGDGEVWATGWLLDEGEEASTRPFAVARFTPEGEQIEQLELEVPVFPTDVLGSTAPLQVVWAGEGAVAVRRITEVLPPDDDGEHLQSTLSLRSIDADGTAGDPVELTDTTCIDCQLSWAIAALAGQVAIVFRAVPLTDDPEEPLEEAPTRYVIVDPAGQVTAAGTFGWEPTEEGLGRFVVDPRGQGFWLTTPDGVVLLDRQLQEVAGPFATSDTGPTPMDRDGSTVHGTWVDDLDSAFWRPFDLDGPPRRRVERVTRGTPQSVRGSERGTGMVVREDGLAFFVWVVDGEKVGGDSRLPQIRGGWPAIGSLFVEPSGSDFKLFIGDKNQVDRMELTCAR